MKGIAADITTPRIGQEELAIEVTTRCNSACLHCFARSGVSNDDSLPVDLVKDIMVEGYDAGYRRLHITGGEPLLWKGLFEAMDYGFSVGYESIFMNTNGTLITEEISKRLANYGNFSFSISLDGPADLHDRIRGKGSHQRTKRGIENAVNGGNDFTIFTTVTKSLLSELPNFVNDLYKDYPTVNGLTLIQLIRTSDEIFSLTEELLDPENFIRLVRMVALLNVCGMQTIVKKNPVAYIVSKLLEMPWIPRVPPLYREGCMIVMANRNIGMVHSNRISFGRYRAGMIKKVLASDMYRKTVATDQETCPSCKYAQLCKENGMIRPVQGYGDPYAGKPYCERVLDYFPSAQAVSGVNPYIRDAYVCG